MIEIMIDRTVKNLTITTDILIKIKKELTIEMTIEMAIEIKIKMAIEMIIEMIIETIMMKKITIIITKMINSLKIIADSFSKIHNLLMMMSNIDFCIEHL